MLKASIALTRRTCLQAGGLSVLGLSSSQLLRLELQKTLGRQQIGDGTSLVRDWKKNQAQALDVLGAASTWKAFNIEDESPSLRVRYGYDRLGRSCLVARRLVEAGVSLVTVIFGGWDTHSHHLEHTRDQLLPPLNRAFGTLLDDLADRGMLDVIDPLNRPHRILAGRTPLIPVLNGLPARMKRIEVQFHGRKSWAT